MNRPHPAETIRRAAKNDIKPQARPQLQREHYLKIEGEVTTNGTIVSQKLKSGLYVRGRFEPVKKSLLDMANEYKEDRLFLAEQLQKIATQIKNLGTGTVNSPNIQSISQTMSTQTDFVQLPLFCQQISEIHQRMRQVDYTIDQPEYSRVRQELYHQVHVDNLMLNRQNLKLAEEMADMAETNDSLNERCMELTRRYEELQKTLSHLYEVGSVKGSRGCPDTETMGQKDDLLGDYFKPVFSPRSSNLSSKRCISPRTLAQFVTSDMELNTSHKMGFERRSPLNLNCSIAMQTDEILEQKLDTKKNIETRLAVLTADNKVKSAIIERMEQAITIILQKQPGSLRLSYDNIEMIIEEIYQKKLQRPKFERHRTLGCGEDDSNFDLDNCKSEGKLRIIPEHSVKKRFSRCRI